MSSLSWKLMLGRGLIFDPSILYMTRFDDFTANDISFYNTPHTEGGNDTVDHHNYSNGYYLLNKANFGSETDFVNVSLNSHLANGDHFVMEMIVEQMAATAGTGVRTFMGVSDQTGGYAFSRRHEWASRSNTSIPYTDDYTGGSDYLGPSGGMLAKKHFAIQFQWNGSTYDRRFYWDGVQRKTFSATAIQLAYFRFGLFVTSSNSDPIHLRIYEVAIRKENRYPNGTTFTPPTTLDGPYL